MTNAKKDNNSISTLLATSNTDGTTTVPIQALPATNRLFVEMGTTGSDLSSAPAKRDDNVVITLMAVSSADGVTPIPIYAISSNGRLLIKIT
jgi:hypothetical protein